jgi:hypothetical protein
VNQVKYPKTTSALHWRLFGRRILLQARRRTRMPARFLDDLPPLPPQAAPIHDEPQIERHETPIDPSQESTLAQYQTEINNSGIYHVYPGGLSPYASDEIHTLQHVFNSSNFAVHHVTTTPPPVDWPTKDMSEQAGRSTTSRRKWTGSGRSAITCSF